MGKIQLTRVDDRLIHGQVMTKWSKGLGINAILSLIMMSRKMIS